MNFHSPIPLIMSWSTLCVKFLLMSIDLIFLPKVDPPKYSLLQHLALKVSQIASDPLYDLFLLSIGIVTFIYTSAVETIFFCSPTNHPYGSKDRISFSHP